MSCLKSQPQTKPLLCDTDIVEYNARKTHKACGKDKCTQIVQGHRVFN